MISLAYKIDLAHVDDVITHLMSCDKDFITDLQSKVDIEEYADKIVKNATTIEGWENDKLVGLIAIYLNNEQTKAGFITNVSVLPSYKGTGLAKELLKRCVQKAKDSYFNSILLEVNKDNMRAINFYKKNKFEETNQKDTSLIMKLELSN